MSNEIINRVKEIIEEEMFTEAYFSGPIVIKKDTVMYPIGYKNHDAPVGRRERRLNIEISRRVLTQLKRASDDEHRDRLLNALHKEISRNFEKLSPQRRFAEWFIDDDSIWSWGARRDCSWK